MCSSKAQNATTELEDKLARLCKQEPVRALVAALGLGASTHLVGGTVRDLAQDREHFDLDLATVLEPDEIASRLNDHGVRVIETGIEHGTVTALLDETPVELTTFRRPGPRSSGRFSKSIETDLKGRDFTINAIAFDIERSKIIDPLDGLSDLRNSLVRAVGSARIRFQEDPLRILRMIRFGPAEGRTLDEPTAAAAKASAIALGEVSAERLRQELDRILLSPFPRQAFETIRDLDLLPKLFPELSAAVGCEQNEFHVEDVYNHLLTVVERCEPNLVLRWSALLHDIGKPYTVTVDEEGRRHFYRHEVKSSDLAHRIAKRLRFSKQMARSITELVRLHMRPLDCGPPGVRRIIRDLGPLFPLWRMLKVADKPPVLSDEKFQSQLDSFDALVASETARLHDLENRSLVVTGDDLIALGFEEGPFLGEVLDELEERVLDDPSENERDLLLSLAKERLEHS